MTTTLLMWWVPAACSNAATTAVGAAAGRMTGVDPDEQAAASSKTARPNRFTSAARGEGAQEEAHVRGSLGEPPHEIAVPVAAIRHVDADEAALVGQPQLLVGSDAVEHL